MKVIIVIPSRYASSRLPGKPLTFIQGKSLLQRVWELGKAVKNVDAVLVATDDERIQNHAQNFAGEVIMTSSTCENGTERVWETIQKLSQKPEIIINLQGDAPLIPPQVIEKLVTFMLKNSQVGLGTVGVPLTWEEYEKWKKEKNQGSTSGTLVVVDKNFKALYFSKGLIPHIRDQGGLKNPPVYHHLGLYAYRYESLQQYVKLSPTPLEQVEKLEQLRALENGMDMHVVPVDLQGKKLWSVDSPEDVKKVEEILRQQRD